MKKYLFILLMILSATCMFGETKALVVSNTIWTEPQNVKVLNDYLEKGWKVIMIERGSGNDTKFSFWLVIIEKN